MGNHIKRIFAVAATLVVSFFVSLILFIVLLYNSETGEFALTSLALSIAISVVCAVLINKRMKFREEHREEIEQARIEKDKKQEAYYKQKRLEKQEKQELKEAKQVEHFESKEAKKLNKLRQKALKDSTGRLTLIGGLGNLPQGSTCDVFYNTVRMKFVAGGQDMILDVSKMMDVSIMTPTEIQKQYVSSIGGAVAGAVLLGPLGAIIGGSASKKTIRQTSYYLVITYRSDEEVKYIVFDITDNRLVGDNIFRKYRSLKENERVRVDL